MQPFGSSELNDKEIIEYLKDYLNEIEKIKDSLYENEIMNKYLVFEAAS